jgi:hypothetical protein
MEYVSGGELFDYIVKKQKLKEVQEILSSEFPVDYPVTDTNLSSLSYACSITAFEGEASDQDK